MNDRWWSRVPRHMPSLEGVPREERAAILERAANETKGWQRAMNAVVTIVIAAFFANMIFEFDQSERHWSVAILLTLFVVAALRARKDRAMARSVRKQLRSKTDEEIASIIATR